MELGIAHVPRFGTSGAQELVRHADDRGLSRAWIADQPLFLDPYVTIASVAAAAPSLRFGVAVTNPFTSHPVLIARRAATLAESVGEGRFVLGLGAGNRREFLAPLGHKAHDVVQRCRDAVTVIRDLLAGERVRHERGFTALDVALSFTPPVVPPIYVAGIGPRILEMAGELADGVIINLASRPGLQYGISAVQRGRAKRTAQLHEPRVVAWAVALVASNGRLEEAYDRVRPFVAHLMAPASPELLDALGVARGTADTIKSVYREHGPEQAARYVTPSLIEHWCWIGSPEALAERIAIAREAGASEAVAVSFFCETPAEEQALVTALGMR